MVCVQYNENKEVCNAIGAHHDEIEMTNMISPIVQACDAISGSRPGARREIMESYMKRLKELEELGMWNNEMRLNIMMNNGSIRDIKSIPEE